MLHPQLMLCFIVHFKNGTISKIGGFLVNLVEMMSDCQNVLDLDETPSCSRSKLFAYIVLWACFTG